MLRASSIAGMAITHTGTSLPHGLSYPLTYELKMPHGKAVGYFLAGFVSKYGDQEEVGRVLGILGFRDVTEFGKYLKELFGPINVSEELLERSAKDILLDSRKLKNYPFEITEQEILAMGGKICK